MTEPSRLPMHLANRLDFPRDLTSRIARKLIMARLDTLVGELRIIDEDGMQVFGRGTSELKATVRIHDPATWTAIALGGSLGAGESYMDGLWTTDDLVSTVRMLLGGSTRLTSLDGSGIGLVRGTIDGLAHRIRRNTRSASRRNIADHYDLGNDFYRLWLDESMMYSSAIWERDDMTLEQAQQARLDRIGAKLELHANDHLLEIGTGWGGMAIHAAKHFGCRVTTTTISEAQVDFARAQVQEAGLEGRVTVLREDYRDLRGRYDKIVSIEMIEAVGAEYLPAFFARFAHLMTPNGLGLIQAITIPDDRYPDSVGKPDFIKRHIFPGGQLPSIHAMGDAWRHTDLRLLHLEDFGEHYARTLHEWRKRFHEHLREVHALGYPNRFVRMWDFYLASCEAAFLERHCGVSQLLFARPDTRRPPVIAPVRS